MQDIRSEWGAVAAFGALATLPVMGLAIAASAKGGLASLPAAVPLAMLAPGLAAIVAQRATGGRVFGIGGSGLRMGRIGWWFAGLLGIGALCMLAFAVTASIDTVAMADAAELRAAVLRLQGVPAFASPVTRAAAALALTALVAPFLNFPLLFGGGTGLA